MDNIEDDNVKQEELQKLIKTSGQQSNIITPLDEFSEGEIPQPPSVSKRDRRFKKRFKK